MLSGSGKAGGYGYNRMSAAVSDAIKEAGFKLDKDIAGVGESAVKEALLAISVEMGCFNPQILSSHP